MSTTNGLATSTVDGYGEAGNGPVYCQNNRIRNAWVDWLGALDWQWFVTYTFPDRIHPEAADKKFRLWMSIFQRHLTGATNWHRPSHVNHTARWVRGLEWQKRGVIHYHALIFAPPARSDLRTFSIQERMGWAAEWQRISGGFGRVDAVASASGALAYLTKYAVKGAAIDISRDICIEPQTPRPLPLRG